MKKRRFLPFLPRPLPRKTQWRKRVHATFVLTMYAMFVMVGGCEWKPFDSDDGKRKDERSAPERAECTDRVTACRNKCYQADRGLTCTSCCEENGRSCDNEGSYSFSSCLDL
jgi:hypothetical protein